MKTIVARAALAVALTLAGLSGAEPPDWQTRLDADRAMSTILVQTTEGRRGKRSEMKWSGGLSLGLSHGETPGRLPELILPDRCGLGYVHPDSIEQGGWRLEDARADWSCGRCLFIGETNDGNEARMDIHVSRVSPAIVFRTTEKTLRFFAASDTASPEYVACPVDGAVRVVNTWTEEVPTESFDSPWLLVWFNKPVGEKYAPLPYKAVGAVEEYAPAVPMLFLFSDFPIAVRGGESLHVEFLENTDPDVMNVAAVMPLYGNIELPSIGDTDAWKNGIPDTVAERCRRWAARLSRIPVSVVETYEAEPAKDVIRIRSDFEYLVVNEILAKENAPYAPVAPMVSLAQSSGFPSELDGTTANETDYLTLWGPYRIIENTASHTLTVRDMCRYALERRIPSNLKAVPETVRTRITEAVEAMVDAGHLAPWVPTTRDFRPNSGVNRIPPHCVWGKPGDVLESLLKIMPILPESLIESTREYVRKERTAYPPETVAAMPYAEGARRERYFVSDDYVSEIFESFRKRSFYSINDAMPVESLYALAEYALAASDNHKTSAVPKETLHAIIRPYLNRADWASLGWKLFDSLPTGYGVSSPTLFWQTNDISYGHGGVRDANAWLKGMIGLVRLTRMSGDAESEANAWGLFARACLFRYGLGKYALFFLDEKSGRTPDLSPPEYFGGNPLHIDAFRDRFDYATPQVSVMNEFLAHLHLHLGSMALPPFLQDGCPEIGRFFRDHLRPETCRMVEHIETNMPDWYTAFCESVIGGDGPSFLHPDDSRQVFMAKAWVCGEEPEKLEWYCDVPWVKIGDLHYIDKLIETAYAYAGTEWVQNLPHLGDLRKTLRHEGTTLQKLPTPDLPPCSYGPAAYPRASRTAHHDLLLKQTRSVSCLAGKP